MTATRKIQKEKLNNELIPSHRDLAPDFKEKYFKQVLDHFNYNSLGNGTYDQRYLITDQYWKKGSGPIFFYTGNEGDIWEFARNSGFITELAAVQGALVIFAEHRYYGKSLPFGKDSFNIPEVGLLTVEQALADYAVMITELKEELGAQKCPVIVFGGRWGLRDIWEFARNSGFITELAAVQGALVIFAEHRYYGKSLPFGKDSFNIPEVGLLTVEQALADYAVMITELKEELGAQKCPVIVFGGSYGGMLSVYMRIRYPNVVTGALAASAPILSTAGLGDSRQFFRDVTSDFEKFNPACRDAVQGAFQKLNTLAQQKDYRRIQSAFSLCKTPSTPKDIHQLNGLLRNAFTMMAMLDYPYSTHFMGSMPAFPVKVACETMLNGTDLMSALRDTVGIVYNSTGQLTCYDLYSLYVECADPTGCGLGFDSYAWDYQACTEIEMCYESNNVTDMFPPMTFTEQQREQYCLKRWGVMPRPGWLKTQFWGDDLSTASNIIFSNGDLDPWANGGIRKSLSPSLIAISIPEGAHHLDLRESNPADPESVIVARKKESEIIAQWVNAAMKESS
ncbi:dipeptidyl peptidase 2 [Labeo rohita]|uniref:Dipeptidyl peptidase 2 n=1 Tax=Labeo rohita TaxID=84645 RepID=A0A498LRS8_LABRO|nr:dipeptidyl peptidase 2 [Labeo rohita]